MKTLNTLLFTVLTVLIATPAFAQDAKPTVATDAIPAAAASIAKHQCVRPEAPGRLASVNRQKSFNKEVDIYKNCLMQFREERNRIARANAEAGNAVVEEFNVFIAEMKKAQ